LRGQMLLALGRTVAGQLPVLVLRPGIFLLALAAVWLVQHRIEAPTAMALQVGAALLALLVLIGLWSRHSPEAMRKAAPAYAMREWAGTCLPMGATESLRMLQGQIAIFLLGLFASASEVGV